jgi:hypothetical protein
LICNENLKRVPSNWTVATIERLPAQLVGDFLANEPSIDLLAAKPSYKPGINLGDLSQALPDYAVDAIREAIPVFDRQIKGLQWLMDCSRVSRREPRRLSALSVALIIRN